MSFNKIENKSKLIKETLVNPLSKNKNYFYVTTIELRLDKKHGVWGYYCKDCNMIMYSKKLFAYHLNDYHQYIIGGKVVEY